MTANPWGILRLKIDDTPRHLRLQSPAMGEPLLANLIGRRCRAVPRQGWIMDGGDPQQCVGMICAIALDRGFVFLLEEDDGRLCYVMTLTHELVMDDGSAP